MTPDRIISVCIGIRNQAHLIPYTLDSIYAQDISGYELEVIVTDDGSDDGVSEILDKYPLTHLYLENHTYHNGVYAKNSSLKSAHGDLIIQQSADVIHSTTNVIKSLVEALPGRRATFASVHNYHRDKGIADDFQYTGLANRRPFFFLGACYREDVCSVGGYDPLLGDVVYYDDNWHADCLLNTCHVKPLFLEVVGWHQNHDRCIYDTAPAKSVYYRLLREAVEGKIKYISSSGPWPYIPGRSVAEIDRGAI